MASKFVIILAKSSAAPSLSGAGKLLPRFKPSIFRLRSEGREVLLKRFASFAKRVDIFAACAPAIAANELVSSVIKFA